MDTGLLILAVGFFSSPVFTSARAHALQVIRFLGAGGLATLLHWSVMATLMLCGVRALTATAIGAAAGALGNYGLQSRWVFVFRAGRKPHTHHRIAAYLGVVIFGWCVNAGAFYAMAAHAPVILAQLVAQTSVAAVSFLLYKNVVFHEYAG